MKQLRTIKEVAGRQLKKWRSDQLPIRRGVIGYSANTIAMAATRLFIHLSAEGLEHIPQQAPYVVAANHETYVDGLWIGKYLPKGHFRRLSCIAGSDLEYQHGWLGRVMLRAGRTIPIDRFGNPVRGLIIAKKKVDEGNILLIHPEGTRTSDGRLGELKDGAAYIAIKSKVPLVPVFIDGAYEVFSRHMKNPQPRDPKTGQKRRIVIRFGAPLWPQDFNNAHEMTAALQVWMESCAQNRRIPREFTDQPVS